MSSGFAATSPASPIHAIEALVGAGGGSGPGATAGTLALITGTEGPSYRRVGAMMAVCEDGQCHGSLSSGCIEADIAFRARAALGAWVWRCPMARWSTG